MACSLHLYTGMFKMLFGVSSGNIFFVRMYARNMSQIDILIKFVVSPHHARINATNKKMCFLGNIHFISFNSAAATGSVLGCPYQWMFC